jgi:predicted esterase
MLTAVIVAVALGVASNESSSAAPNEGYVVHDSEVKDGKLPSFISSSLAKRFDHFVYRRPGQQGTDSIHFRLFRPVDKGVQKCPLLVWLHGAGESGTDNVSQLCWLGLLFEQASEPPPMFILAVQCPHRDVGWSIKDDYLLLPADRIAVTLEIVSHLLRDMPIDPERVYLSGVSTGGGACWDIVMRKPDLFAAVAPLAGSARVTGDLATLKDVPIWAFHNDDDDTISPKSVEQTVLELREAGGQAVLTLTASKPELPKHNCWTAAFEDYGLADWLLRQNRSEADAPLPGSVSLVTRWNVFRRDYVVRYWPVLWPRLLTLMAVIGVVLLARREMHKKVRA